MITPEYNASIPAVVKNAIDWLSRPYGEGAVTAKPLAVIGASGGRYGGGLAVTAPFPYGRDNQSIAFFTTAGMLALYSGVITRTASASATAARRLCAAAGASAPSMSSL